jgi:Dolichyl-phosphate-mannose-protein mannosyltransferase
VSSVAALPAALAGFVLFFVPGLVFLALLSREDRDDLALDEALFLAVAVSVIASAWLGLVLAEAGFFSLVGAAAILGAAALGAALVGRRRLVWPLPRPRSAHEIGPALVLLALAVTLQCRPSQYIMGGRDPGAYIASMGIIARTGGIVFQDPLVRAVPREDVELFYRHPSKEDFSWSRFMGFDLERPESGRVFPQFFHLFPAFGAYLFQAMGQKGALATPCVFGVLGTLGVFFAFRRIFGREAALLASLFLAVNVVQVWFARFPVSEPVSQFLIFCGLLAFSRWETHGSPAFGALAGTAFGLTLLVRIDSVLIVLPLALYFVARPATGAVAWRRAAAVLVPFALLSLHAAFHAAFWARKYVVQIATRRYWRYPAPVWALAAAAVLGLVVLAWRYGPTLGRTLPRHQERLRALAGAFVIGLALYAYFLRPELSAWAGGDGNARGVAVDDPGLQTVLHALGFQRLAAHDAQAFFRLGWFVSPLGLLLGTLGLVAVLRAWRARYLLPVLTAVTFAGFYFYKIRIWNDYYFALRRFVPVVLPFLFGFTAFLLVRLAQRGGLRRVSAGLLALGLLALYAKDTAPLFRYVDWKGSVDFVSDVARRFGPEDVVIFEQPKSVHLLSLPLWAAYGVGALELARFNPDPERLLHLVRSWRGRYRNVYFVHTPRTDLCGVFLERVEPYSFGTYEWERTYRSPPRRPEVRSLHFTISRFVAPEDLNVPPLPEVDVGASDDVQVSGFFDKEILGGERTYRWSGACGSVYLPAARPGTTVAITAAMGPRAEEAPAEVRVSLAGTPLGAFAPGKDFREFTVAVPDSLPEGPAVLRLDVPVWRPRSDFRELGLMVDRIRVVPGGRARVPVSAPSGGGS